MKKIKKIEHNKKHYMSLLLLADPSEEKILEYLEPGDLFALFFNEKLRTTAVVTTQLDGTCELKNLATKLASHNRGYGGDMMEYLLDYYKDKCECMLVGTSEAGVAFYEKYGFEYSHRIEEFFLKEYPEPVLENGIQCVDLIYLKKKLK